MRRWIIILLVIIFGTVLIAGGFFFTRTQVANSDLRTTTIQPQTVVQDVTFTGRLEAATSSDVSFELPGTVTALYVKEGDIVTAGQSVASLDTSAANLELAQASATKASSQDTAKLALEQAERDLQHTRTVGEETLNKRRQAVRDAKIELDQAKQVHQQRAAESGDTSAVTETTISTLRAAETAYHAAQQTLTETQAAVQQSNTTAVSAVETARAKYISTTQAAPGVAGLSSLEAAQALVAQKITKHTLVAPFNGTVTTLHRQLGEAALAGSAVVTVATLDEIELVASATETDAIKLAPGMSATVTFDALPATQEYTATVSYLSPAATIVEGVSIYTIKLAFTESPENLKPGLSANITVHAAKVDNVLAIPRRAISVRNQQEYVSLMNDDGTVAERKITTGLIGSDGTVEITSGLASGDTVVVNPGQLQTEQ